MRDFTLEIGRVIDKRYKLLSLSGVGASGAVFRAYDSKKETVVAMKLFDEAVADGEELGFLTEARAIASLQSEYIVKLFDAGVENGERYLVMEYVDGCTLREYMDRRRARGEKMPFSELLTSARQLASALSEAHKKGTVHRDIKPQNIIVTKTGKLKLMDFGIAQLSGDDPYTVRRAVGTAHYISPEQAGALPVDMRSDIYSLGVLLYEMATGVLPFTAETPREIAMKQVQENPRPPRLIDPDIPIGLEQIILTAMQKNPDRRFRRAEDLSRALTKLEKNPELIFSDFQNESVTEVGARRRLATRSTRSPLFITLISVILALAVLSVALLFVLRFSDPGTQSYTMPNLLGEIYTEGEAPFDELASVRVEYVDSELPAGTVVGQSPAAGEVFADKITAVVTVSRGEG